MFSQLFALLGMVFVFAVGLILNAADATPTTFFHTIVTVNCFFVLFQSILLLVNFIPESPNSLLARNKQEQAKIVVGLFHKVKVIKEVVAQKQLEVDKELGNAPKNPTAAIDYAKISYVLAL